MPKLNIHNSPKDVFQNLPIEILGHIITYLDLKALAKLAQTGQFMHKFVNNLDFVLDKKTIKVLSPQVNKKKVKSIKYSALNPKQLRNYQAITTRLSYYEPMEPAQLENNMIETGRKLIIYVVIAMLAFGFLSLAGKALRQSKVISYYDDTTAAILGLGSLSLASWIFMCKKGIDLYRQNKGVERLTKQKEYNQYIDDHMQKLEEGPDTDQFGGRGLGQDSPRYSDQDSDHNLSVKKAV